MELLVRSQDKETLTKYDCLSLKKYGVFPNHIIFAHIGNNIIDLGIYKTKERALEVLDEIQRRLTLPNYEITNNKYSQYDKLVESRTSKESSTYVYEMPQE